MRRKVPSKLSRAGAGQAVEPSGAAAPAEAASVALPESLPDLDALLAEKSPMQTPALADPGQPEAHAHRAAELLESVSAAAIQLHPSALSDTGGAPPAGTGQATAALDDQPMTAGEGETVIPAHEAPEEPSPAPAPVTTTRIPAEGSVPAGALMPPAPPAAFPGPSALLTSARTVSSYLSGESAAALSHLQALGRVRSPVDLVDMQLREASRATAAAFAFWCTLASPAGGQPDR